MAGESQSMEEILSSIRRIIADDDANPPGEPRPAGPHAGTDEEEPLELGEAEQAAAERIEDWTPSPKRPPVAGFEPGGSGSGGSGSGGSGSGGSGPDPAASEPGAAGPAGALVSEQAAHSAQAALTSLATLSVRADAPDGTLDALVRDMLRPMLKAWLDTHLPEVVERVVAREVARITGR